MAAASDNLRPLSKGSLTRLRSALMALSALDEKGVRGAKTLSAEQLLVLTTILWATDGKAKEVTQRDLIRQTGVSAGSMSRAIARLSDGSYERWGGDRGNGLGLVEQAPDPNDSRYRVVRPTQKGERLRAQLKAIMGEDQE